MVCKDEKADNNKKCSINKLLEISHGATVPMPVFYHILIISDVNTFFTPYVLNIFYLKALLNCIMKYFIMVFHPKVCCINSCSFLWCIRLQTAFLLSFAQLNQFMGLICW